nr:PREDICTED: CMT1A duplicated region transcript 1 protein isoform X1 [Lepisosteus oculatus]
MRSFEDKERHEFRIDAAHELRCGSGDSAVRFCGSCEACRFNSRLSAATRWFTRAGDASKRRFLTGLILRCQSLDLLVNTQKVLQVTLGKDFTYSRSRAAPSLDQDSTTWSADRALDSRLLGREMLETWEWFAGGKYWTKAKFILALLALCDADLVHVLGNLVRVLVVRGKRESSSRQCDRGKSVLEDLEDDSSSIPESHYSFRSEDHPELELLIQASSGYEPVTMETHTSVWALAPVETLEDRDPEPSESGPLEQSPCTGEEEESHSPGRFLESDEDQSVSSDDPALVTLPSSSQSLSGVGHYRDFIRRLPVHLAKHILGLLDNNSLVNCLFVSQHWRYLAEEIQKEVLVRRTVENQAMILQGTSSSGVSPVYAKIRDIPVPMTQEEKLTMPFQDSSNKMKPKDRSVEAAYVGVETKTIQMEERNVYCGTYNILVLNENEDSSRVAHYNGGKMVAIGSKDRQVRLLDLANGKEVPPLIHGHAGSIRAVLLCEERGFVISASYDLSIRCWNLQTGACMKIFRGHLGTISCLDLHGNRLVSGAKDCKVKVWNLLTGKNFTKLKFKHQDPILCVKIDKSYVVSGCRKGLVKVWHIETGCLMKTVEGHQGAVKCLFFDQWHILSGGSDGYIMAWSMNKEFQRCLMAFRHPKEVQCLAFLYLRVVSGCADGKIRVFNFLTGDCLRVIKANSRQSPVLSLDIHSNSIVMNTKASVLLFQFAEVKWDYSLTAEGESDAGKDKDRTWPRGSALRKHPYPYVRAQRMKRVGSTNRKIYHRQAEDREGPGSGLSHHARSLSSQSMHAAHSVQRESMRPAKWSELPSYRRSTAYIDLQPEFIAKPPSALEPGRPVSGRSPETGSRASRTPKRHSTASSGKRSSGGGAEAQLALSRSEQSVLQQVKQRGLHHPISPEHLLLALGTAHQAQRSDPTSSNTVLNARVRDAWGSPPAPQTAGHESEATISQKAPQPKTTDTRSAPVRFREVTKIYTPLVSKGLDLKLRHSLHGHSVRSSLPRPAVVRPQTGTGPGEAGALETGRRRPQTSGSAGARQAGSLSATAERGAPRMQRMLLGTPCSSPQRHVRFEQCPAESGPSKHYPVDPFREHSGFRLQTFTQRQQSQQNQARQHEAALSQEASDRDKQSKRAWLMKVKGLPIGDFLKEGQVFAPELGHDSYI